MRERGQPLTEQEANDVFDVLVVECGAASRQREHFVANQTTEFIDEWRFQGNLGFGGKFRRSPGWDDPANQQGWGEQWYVDQYREERTTETADMVWRANERLSKLRKGEA